MSTITDEPALLVYQGAAGLVALIVSLVTYFQSKAIKFEFRTIGEQLDRVDGKFATLDRSIASVLSGRFRPPAQRGLHVLQAVSAVEVVLASDGGTVTEHEASVAEHGRSAFPTYCRVPSENSYGVGKIPYAVLIGEDGRIAVLGLVNSREHIESLFEARERKLGFVQEYLRQEEPEFFYNALTGGTDQ